MTSPLNILIVEDSPANQEIVKTHLHELKHHVDTANNGKEAIDRLNKQVYDVIFMDSQMPVMDGLKTTEAIRNQSSTSINSQTYIIALTADTFPDTIDKLKEAGINDIIEKPFSQKDILQALEKIPVQQASPSITSAPKKHSQKILDLFLSETQENVKQLKDALSNQDGETIRLLAHKIEGTSSNFDVPEIRKIANTIKHQSTSSPDTLIPLIKQLEDSLSLFQEKLSKNEENN